MKKITLLIIIFSSTSVFAQANSQDIYLNQGNSAYNKNQQTNKTCISMLEELDRMKSWVKDQHPSTVDYFKNKEAYIRVAAEWIKVCGVEKK